MSRISATAAVIVSLSAVQPALANSDDMDQLKRLIDELRTENRALAARVSNLEAQQPKNKAPTQVSRKSLQPSSAQRHQPPAAAETVIPPSAVQQPQEAQQSAVASPPAPSQELEDRVRELEIAKTAQEDATRSIIRDALSKTGPKINEYVSLGGSLEVLVGRFGDFSGPPTDTLSLNTAELDFDIRANEWATASLAVQYESGSTSFLTTNQSPSATDRLTLDKGTITIGDAQRFPLFAKGGLDYLEFGTTTGTHGADVLAIENPLTIEAFEIRNPILGFGFGLPTPAQGPSSPPVVIPPVRPLVVAPLIGHLGRSLGYSPPPTRPSPLTPTTLAPSPPPFYGSFYVYSGNSEIQPNLNLAQFYNASLGYRTSGHCGRPYEDLRRSYVCPWEIDVHVDYVSSVFDSLFLQDGYGPFLSQIGRIPAMAASIKVSAGPFAFVGEWNSALKAARFDDGLGRPVSITPTAWQFALAYQFDWNPWIETIGAQGDYIAIGYSGSQGLAGVTSLINGAQTRVGSVPQRRITLTAGEWVLDNLKLAVEYSLNFDYPKKNGGTGNYANGIFSTMTYNF